MLLTIPILSSKDLLHMLVDIDLPQLAEKLYLVDLLFHHRNNEVVCHHNYVEVRNKYSKVLLLIILTNRGKVIIQ